MRPPATDLIYDWNTAGERERSIQRGITLFDETLRDGLQNPSVVDPPVAEKIRLLHLMSAVGVHGANIGFPASSRRAFDDVARLGREIVDAKLGLIPACAGRTLPSDVGPMIEIAQRIGVPLHAYLFIASSPIRQLAEAWEPGSIERRSAEAVEMAARAGLIVTYVTEDTTRSRPEVLSTLFKLAIDRGAQRICLADTVGHATPSGVRNLVVFARRVVAETGADAGIDWHGHNDRGLALENALSALEHGADRVHGTALGIGERAGNTPMELLLLNLSLLGMLETGDVSRLVEYGSVAASALGWQIPPNHPLVGRDVFRTATGVHAAAIIKAQARGDTWLADRVYSSVPASMFGRKQELCVGYMSGSSNVTHWLQSHGFGVTPDIVEAILTEAKRKARTLSDEEILAIARRVQGAETPRRTAGSRPS
jgi:2-isopropylmalate synthase